MMQNPPHPGPFIRRTCLEPLGLTVAEAAKHLGVTRQTLSRLLNEQCGISPEMAVRLSAAFGRKPETWMRQQIQYDLCQATKKLKSVKITSLV